MAQGADEQIVNFIDEAEQSLKEVAYAITEGILSDQLPSTPSCAYFNLTTREDEKMTVRLTMRGFEVVGHSYNSRQLEEEGTDSNPLGGAFETIYALLQKVSPSYQHTFQEAVSRKLQTELGSQ